MSMRRVLQGTLLNGMTRLSGDCATDAVNAECAADADLWLSKPLLQREYCDYCLEKCYLLVSNNQCVRHFEEFWVELE
ncbi:unnamed protein product [Gongylonema pulchrum]|uniref:Secreted protein n=1 Tax=Gongylonema pulchrum TaxID=637853 RepID=A0A183E0W5_9BILA|nr:unnamed protein product [Gongylonema pulchrum]